MAISNPLSVPQSSNSNLITFDNCINRSIDLAANSPNSFLKANSKRIYAAFVNNSASQITLSLGDIAGAKVGQGILLSPYGGSFEISSINLYVGAISAVSSQSSSLSFVECSF
ncbi:MAG: hypothetical protein H0X31_00880 [Nostocaceae cyanobacterium]|nr:hypothetical protein [Nostocaceae cyanobacterium]